jgi:hypothetical protein
MGMMTYPAVQSMFDSLYPKGMQWYWRGDFVETLPDAAIEVHLEHAAKAPSELSLMHLYPIDGAVHRVSGNETAWNCRKATWSMVIAGIDPNPQKAGLVTRWTKAYWEAVHPFDLGGAYPNFMMDDEGDARLRATYGDNYERLTAVKRKYDGANLRIPTMATPELGCMATLHSGMTTQCEAWEHHWGVGHVSVERFGQARRSPSP